MGTNELMPLLQISDQGLGMPQRSGALSVLPVCGPSRNGRFASPLSGLKLAGVRGYGNVELENPRGHDGITIVPLHMGFIQDGAQNHAMCRSAFLASGQRCLFDDACCIQQGQGGFLKGAEQWFFILPLQLRERALALRGVKNYGKLWPAITELNADLGLSPRGHLEQIVGHQRPYLTQYAHRFELQRGQTGAVFFLNEQLVGIEIAPSARYFADLWMPLVSFCYGTAAMQLERLTQPILRGTPAPFAAQGLDGLRQALAESRHQVCERMLEAVRTVPKEEFGVEEDECFLDLRLKTITGRNFVGQTVDDGQGLVYASIVSRKHHLPLTVGDKMLD